MPNLAASPESVTRSIDLYWGGARSNPDLINDASKAKQWKCYLTHDGEWRCGPSRFVGYEGMTPNDYVKRKKSAEGGLNGTETQYHLRQWMDEVSESSKLHRQLSDVVADYLDKAGISLNRKARFSILRCVGSDEKREPNDPEDETVEALFMLSKSLSANARRSLMQRLAAL